MDILIFLLTIKLRVQKYKDKITKEVVTLLKVE